MHIIGTFLSYLNRIESHELVHFNQAVSFSTPVTLIFKLLQFIHIYSLSERVFSSVRDDLKISHVVFYEYYIVYFN